MTLLSRKADYAMLIVSYLHARPEGGNARAIAERFGLSRPFVANILKELCHRGYVVSHRGVKGGYRIAREPARITIEEIIRALEGPIAITECIEGGSDCEIEGTCPVRTNWQRINAAVKDALAAIPLSEMAAQVAFASHSWNGKAKTEPQETRIEA